jgi:hypothetical protein
MNIKDNQRTVIQFLFSEGCTGGEIVTRLGNVYGVVAYCRASVFRWIRKVRPGNEKFRSEGCHGRRYRHETNTTTRSLLQKESNTLMRTIAEILSISPVTIRTRVPRIAYLLKTLCLIPHALACELKYVRLTMRLQSLPKLRSHARDTWRHFITGDENWLYDEYVRDRTWTARDGNTPEVEDRTVASGKSMLNVI